MATRATIRYVAERRATLPIMNASSRHVDVEGGPRVDAAFFCESFSRDDLGFVTYHRVVQSFALERLPAKLQRFAIGILVSRLPVHRQTTLDLTMSAPGAIIELEGSARHTIEIPPTANGYAQLSYDVRNLQLAGYGEYRVEFFFEGATESSHVAQFWVEHGRPLIAKAR